MASADLANYTSNNHRKYTCGNWFYQRHIEVFLERLLEMLGQAHPATVLDAGCGEGFVIDYLGRHAPDLRLTGVDLSEEAVAYARAHFGDRGQFRTGSIYALPFSDKSFDLVLCSEVLEHLDDPDRAVAELKRVARNHVLITVPLEPYFKWLNDLGQLLRVGLDPGHVNFWTKQGFQEFVHRHFDGEVTFDWKHIYQLALAPV